MTPAELRRLLELAAKAVGLKIYGWDSVLDCPIAQFIGHWNPADDDGDSRRLEVKLGFTVHHFKDSCRAAIGVKFYSEPYGDDPYTATRLAVLRAAAAIGEAMP